MGTSAAENIAFQIDTSYDGSGIKEARDGLTTLNAAVEAGEIGINQSIGAFTAYGKTIDATSKEAVAMYRQQGDALSANLAQLGATEAELNKIGAAITKVERSAGASIISPNSPQSQHLEGLPAKARTAGNAVALLSQAAVAGTGSVAGMAVAAGNLATGLAEVTKSAKLAAGATGIGLLVTIGATAYGVVHDYTEQTKKLNEQLADTQSEIRGIDDAAKGDQLGQQIEGINRAADAQIRQLEQMHFHEDARNKVIGEINEKRQKEIGYAKQTNDVDRSKQIATLEQAAAGSAEDRYRAAVRLIELERQDRERQGFGVQAAPAATNAVTQINIAANEAVRSAQQQATQLLAQLEDSAAGRRAAIQDQYQEEVRNIETLTLRDGDREKIMTALNDQREYGLQLLDREIEMTNRQAHAEMQQLSDNANDQLQVRLEQIEIEKEAQIAAGVAVATATEAAERKKRQLYAETARQASQNAVSIIGVLESTNNKALKAVGTFGENLRRVVIGAEAARALVRSAVEGAEAIASLATGDFRGAALHGSAALEFGAAAALGARESLGGGGGGGGGAGGGGGSSSTFSPSSQANGGGATVINLYTTDPYGRESILRVSYLLQRAGILNVPIHPTSSLGAVVNTINGDNFTTLAGAY
jgi:hypothetical protein